ncbi:RDD family protein [Streptomyces formicae]|uniref:RDD family protein n=1 Tax=Streptomyces formicae TaxID=1616117 RepID=A0ABY3WTG9_9ACTN|nr:RDD family protein [Streptomyces formicae]UNM15400.1 RDD family protein [Streptomyces formicae]
MSAPTPATGDGSPTAGFYPDPSIPGYVRYWNGVAWVPGTSRPAPKDGEAMPSPPHSAAAHSAAAATAGPSVPAPSAPPVEETGPVFLDEDLDPSGGPRPEPATAWQADASRQSGFGGDHDQRVSWGAASAASAAAAAPSASPSGSASGSGEASGLPSAPAPAEGWGRDSRPDPRAGGAAAGGSSGVRFDRPSGRTAPDPRSAGDDAAPVDPTGGALPGVRSVGGERKPATDGTMAIRSLSPRASKSQAQAQAHAQPQAQAHAQPQAQAQAQAPAAAPAQAQQQVSAQQQPPLSAGVGGGAASWAQQVHRLAQGQAEPQPQQPVMPWKPPVDDPFLQVAQAQAASRPAGLGKRFVARLIDTVVLGAIAGAASSPFVSHALTHIDEKIQAAKMSGETVTVWLLDATTITQFGIALAVLLLLGVVYEALPTAKWGRTLGKKLLGLEVRDIESHEPPGFAAALRRWLVHGVLGVLAIGVVNVLWCLFDHPWRQCWHDKAARTFVAG